MTNCVYCGKKMGFLSKKDSDIHLLCKDKYQTQEIEKQRQIRLKQIIEGTYKPIDEGQLKLQQSKEQFCLKCKKKITDLKNEATQVKTVGNELLTFCNECYSTKLPESEKILYYDSNNITVCHICKGVCVHEQPVDFTNENNENLTICSPCYNELPTDEKFKLHVKKKSVFDIDNTGLQVAQYFIGGSDSAMKQRDYILGIIKQYDLTLVELDKYFITNAPSHKHFLLSPDRYKEMTTIAEVIKKNKLNELAQKQFSMDYDKLKFLDKHRIDGDLKRYTNENERKNRRIKDLKTYLMNQ